MSNTQAPDFIISKGDLLPEINATLKDDTDTPINLSGCTVRFLMATSTTTLATPVIDSTATVVNAALGLVKYSWTSPDTASKGNYVARWKVTDGLGKVETFPNINFTTITITDNF